MDLCLLGGRILVNVLAGSVGALKKVLTPWDQGGECVRVGERLSLSGGLAPREDSVEVHRGIDT